MTDVRCVTWFLTYWLLYFHVMFQFACFSLPRDYKHCSLLWKWLKWVNERLSLFQDAAGTRTLNETALSFFLPFSIIFSHAQECSKLILFSWMPLMISHHYFWKCTVVFTVIVHFLQCNNFFLVFSCIYHSRPLMTTWGVILLRDLHLFKSTKHDWPRPVLKNAILKWTRPFRQPNPPTSLASQSEYLWILMYFSPIPFPTQNKQPHQNYPNPLCGSWFANSCLFY